MQNRELYKFLTSGIILIGYNCLNYDSQLIEFILNRFGKVNSSMLYKESQRVIEMEFPEIPEWKLKIPHLDLLKIWHFDNKAKITSLKWIQFSINWYNIEDMPFEHYHCVLDKERDLIKSYCWNDVNSTYEFYKITKGQTELDLYKGKDKLELRRNINEQFNVNSFNWNDVKIGDRINQITYLNRTGKKSVEKGGTTRSQLVVGDCISDKIQFKTQFLKDFLVSLKKKTFDPSKVKEEKGWEFWLGDLRVSFGFGGIHSIDRAREIYADDNYYIIDRDVASMYPAKILNRQLYPEHLGPQWLEGYKWIHDERVYKWKDLAKKDKVAATYSEVYKLAMNGGKSNKKVDLLLYNFYIFVY